MLRRQCNDRICSVRKISFAVSILLLLDSKEVHGYSAVQSMFSVYVFLPSTRLAELSKPHFGARFAILSYFLFYAYMCVHTNSPISTAQQILHTALVPESHKFPINASLRYGHSASRILTTADSRIHQSRLYKLLDYMNCFVWHC